MKAFSVVFKDLYSTGRIREDRVLDSECLRLPLEFLQPNLSSLQRDSMLARYLLSWFLLAIVAVANGVIREFIYGKHVSDLLAHQISTGTGILFTGLLVWGLSRFWPIESFGQAWIIGACWCLATISFEFGFGYFVAGHSWKTLVSDYNILNGRIWLLFLVWITITPYVFYKYG